MNQLTGKILYIYPPQQIPSRDGTKTLAKRSVVIDCTRFDPYTGERGHENTPQLEFIGERCAELDKFQVGDIVTISFDVQGSRYRNKGGVEQIFTRVQPFRIEPRQSKAQSAPQPAQEAPQTAQAFAPEQPFTPTATEDKSDLPF